MHVPVLYMKNFLTCKKCFCKGCVITAIFIHLHPPVQLQIVNSQYLLRERLLWLVHSVGIKQVFFSYSNLSFTLGWHLKASVTKTWGLVSQGRTDIINGEKKSRRIFFSFCDRLLGNIFFFPLCLLVKKISNGRYPFVSHFWHIFYSLASLGVTQNSSGVLCLSREFMYSSDSCERPI